VAGGATGESESLSTIIPTVRRIINKKFIKYAHIRKHKILKIVCTVVIKHNIPLATINDKFLQFYRETLILKIPTNIIISDSYYCYDYNQVFLNFLIVIVYIFLYPIIFGPSCICVYIIQTTLKVKKL
jgi:hypothetical protein